MANLMFDMPDQSGRLAIVTGANVGLGFEMTKILAEKNAEVIMACRTPEKGEQARQNILAQVPSAKIRVEKLDVSSLASVREFADRLLPQLSRIDLLINNAGIMAVPFEKSVDGFEMQFATNHLGHFLLTGLLLPKLLETQNSRVVSVASLAAKSGKIDFDDLMGEKHYDTWKAYNQSKLANLMFAMEMQRRLTKLGGATVALSAHPGGSTTNLFATPGGSFVKRIFMPLTKHILFQSAEAGAQPILYAATSPQATPGGYYGPAKMGEMKGAPKEAFVPPAAKDLEVARQLWEESERLVGFKYLDA